MDREGQGREEPGSEWSVDIVKTPHSPPHCSLTLGLALGTLIRTQPRPRCLQTASDDVNDLVMRRVLLCELEKMSGGDYTRDISTTKFKLLLLLLAASRCLHHGRRQSSHSMNKS
ncbi:hypothetical protein E2C01_083519 [Portunus trituberculatus]|uniref:Uncharacterized protein n=1 Tax=Portunus trituberculatus TaxID=210409 RepID=A0A5B7J884_PORTR|nr:hypothetical protein [Portunus trituberculatus]